MSTQTQPVTTAAAAAAAKPAPQPGILQRIVIGIEDGFKHVVLDIPEAESVLQEVAAVSGSKAAATAAAILGLAKSALAAYENAGKATITPAEIAKLLPDATPLVAPQTAPASAPAASASTAGNASSAAAAAPAADTASQSSDQASSQGAAPAAAPTK